MNDRFALLRSNERDRPQRQRTMTDLLSWSYDHLGPIEQQAFRRLGVFGGSFDLGGAVAVLAGDELPERDVPDQLWRLVDKSLVVTDSSKNATRYRLLETIRAFAQERLVESGEFDEAARRLGANMLERVAPWFAVDRRWIGEVAVEIDNVRSVVTHASSRDYELAGTLAVTVGRFHDATQMTEVGIQELAATIDLVEGPSPVRVVMLTTLADLHLRRGDAAPASELLAHAEDLAAAVGVPAWSDVALDRTRGEILSRSGQHSDAAHVALDALERPEVSMLGVARMSNLLGISRYAAGDLAGAIEAFRRELELFEELGVDASVASANANLAEVLLQLGEQRSAARHQLASLELALAIGQPVMAAYSSLVAARLAAGGGRWELSVRLIGAGEAALAAVGHRLYDADQVVLDELRSRAIEVIGAERVDAQTSAGAGLDVVDAAALATELFTEAIDAKWVPPPATE